MDQQSLPDRNAAEQAGQRDRRREKPQLSCSFCKRRKMRCDRQLPCKTCVSKGIALSCSYNPSQLQKRGTSVGEHIQQLESLVRSLSQQQQLQQDPRGSAASPIHQSAGLFNRSSASPPEDSPTSHATALKYVLSPTASDQDARHSVAQSLSPKESEDAASPQSSGYGSLRKHTHGASYVSNDHWAAVLDSISELKDRYEREEEAKTLAAQSWIPHRVPGPRLLYEPVHATKSDVLSSLPARPIVDRMVARYFALRGLSPAILHSDQFLKEYERFWENPLGVDFIWIGLLFSIMCLAAQYQHLAQGQSTPETLMQVQALRDRTVHCLVLGQFTRGGLYVLETLINHFQSEVLLCKDADIGYWLLLGMIGQLALSLGYHRDPINFPSISPFNGEMRRRVWAAVVQLDLRLSSQMGLPRVLKSQQSDTAEPRNLLDSDFDGAATELPPSRPETEVTPVLYGLAKNRIDSISGPINDLIAETREHSYSEIMKLDQLLRVAEASLPPIYRWVPLSQSFLVPPQVNISRIWLQLALQRLAISLHRRYLAPSHTQKCYGYSHASCLRAAIKILEFQQLIEEETQPDGLLHTVYWMASSLLQSTFLLGMSVACYYVQLAKSTPDLPLEEETNDRIIDLLHKTYPILLRSSAESRDAREGLARLHALLQRWSQQDGLRSEGATHAFSAEDAALLDQANWDAYEGMNRSWGPFRFETHGVNMDS